MRKIEEGDMKTRALLVGTGGWAETHLRAYGACEQIELAALVGHRNEERLRALAETYAVPVASLGLAEALKRVEPDMVDFACNPHFRLEGVRAAMQPSVKLINLEKPMALAPSEAYEIAALCRSHGKRLTINHQKKYLPAWRHAKELIAAGELGDLEHLRATCRGNLLEQGTHLVDMVLHYNDYQPVSWVMGQIDELEGLDKPGASAPDAALACLAFENGVRAILTIGSLGHALPGESNKWHQFAVEAYGTRGHLRVTLNKTLEFVSYAKGETWREPSSWDEGYVQAVAQHLTDAARYAQNPEVGHISDLERSLASFNVIMAIYASGCGDGMVRLPQRFSDDLIARLEARRSAAADGAV
jgi:predicted dehydrogenase